MNKVILLILFFQFSGLHAEFKFYESMYRSSEYINILEKGLNTKEVKLQPDESDTLVAVMRCTSGAFAGRYKFADFLIYKNGFEYSYLQILLTDKKHKVAEILPLMGFVREDSNATLYFHNIIDLILFTESMAQYSASVDISNPALLKVYLQTGAGNQININSISLSALYTIRPSITTQKILLYKPKNCKLIDKESVKADLDYYYSLEFDEFKQNLNDSIRQF